jgi:glutathione S-transferase
MAIKIYSTQGSRGMRPIWTAEEMGLEYEVEMMPFPPRFMQPEYMKVNILGTIPYLIDGDARMTESVGISQYLVDRYGPTDLKVNIEEDDYPSYLNWLAHSDATITFPQTVFIRYTLQEPGVADKAAEGYRRWFLARLKLLEVTLEDREYLCSNRLVIYEAFKPNILRCTDMLFEREAFKKIEAYKYEGPGPAGPND